MMSAFNDYCTVCGQLIQRDVAEDELLDDRLYCSSQCQENDRLNVENFKLSNELSGTPASLIRSPLLQPVDGSRASHNSLMESLGLEQEQNDYDYDFELEMPLDNVMIGSGPAIPMMTIPRSVLGSDSMSKPDVVCDNTAEDNYKLWLNYNLTS